jgi:cell filamentation protein
MNSKIDRDPEDPYSYKSDSERKVLINKFNIRDFDELKIVERRISRENLIKIKSAEFTIEGFKNIHQRLFGEIYEWAGKTRNVNISGGMAMFAPARFIEQCLNAEFLKIGKDIKEKSSFNNRIWLQKAAEHFGELITIHPFRDGNGRTTRLFTDLFLKEKNLKIDWREIDIDQYYKALEKAIMEADHSLMTRLFEKHQKIWQ